MASPQIVGKQDWPQNSNFPFLFVQQCLKLTFNYLYFLNHWWWDLFQVKSQAEYMLLKSKKEKSCWEATGVPWDFCQCTISCLIAAKYHGLPGRESHLPKDREMETVSKSNWREQQTKMRTIDIDTRTKSIMLCMQGCRWGWRHWEKWCVFLGSDTCSLCF